GPLHPAVPPRYPTRCAGGPQHGGVRGDARGGGDRSARRRADRPLRDRDDPLLLPEARRRRRRAAGGAGGGRRRFGRGVERRAAGLGASRGVAGRRWRGPLEGQTAIAPRYSGGVGIVVEVGPRGSLSAFVEDILRGRPPLAIAADTMNRSGITQLNHVVGLL